MPRFVILVAGTSGSSRSRLDSGILRRRMVQRQTAHSGWRQHSLLGHSSSRFQHSRLQAAGWSLRLRSTWAPPNRVSAKQTATRPAAMSNRMPQRRRRLLKLGAAPAAAAVAAAMTTLMMLSEAAPHQTTMMKRRLHLPEPLMRTMRLVRRA